MNVKRERQYWTDDGTKQLVSVRQPDGKIHVDAFELTLTELGQLARACEAVLNDCGRELPAAGGRGGAQ